MKKLSKDNKGFTLVEMIVVLVILAILAAILVPALLGYIDEAKQKQYVLHGKSAYTAAQSVASEMYAAGVEISTTNLSATSTYGKRIADIADLDEFANCTSVSIGFKQAYDEDATGKDKHEAYTVDYVIYVEDGETIYLYNNDWVALEEAPDRTGKSDTFVIYSASTGSGSTSTPATGGESGGTESAGGEGTT